MIQYLKHFLNSANQLDLYYFIQCFPLDSQLYFRSTTAIDVANYFLGLNSPCSSCQYKDGFLWFAAGPFEDSEARQPVPLCSSSHFSAA